MKLDNIDPEDFEETLLKLEKSFGITFTDDSFTGIKTFGDICNVIENHLIFTNKDDCTAQQAFYKVRKAISLTQNVEERDISLQTKLADIFPRSSRRQDIKRFEQALAFSVNILTIKKWLVCTLVIAFILSLVALFFNWQIAVAGLVFFIFSLWIAAKFSKELNISTVKELTEKVLREHYSLARRHSETGNRKEIVKIIQDVFTADYAIDKQHLTKDASLGLI